MTATPGNSDVWLGGTAALVSAVALALALAPAGAPPGSDLPVVASMKFASREVKLRAASSLGWSGASHGTPVHDGDTIFVPPGGEATVTFPDGSELSLDERSLIVVEQPRPGMRRVTLRQGAASGRAGEEALTLDTPAGEARLTASSEVRVELNGESLELQVTKGEALVADTKLSEGQRAAAAKSGTQALSAFPVTLTQPEARAHHTYRNTPPALALRWQGETGGARVQVARDRFFAFIDVELPAAGGEVVLREPSRGVSWWRLVDARGRVLSEARRFTFVEDVAPVAMFPRNGEVLLAPPGAHLNFAWAPLPGVTRYRLELSMSQGFEPVSETREVTGSSARLKLPLSEASWFWRVRALTAGVEGAPSTPQRFRVIHKGIPAAPELLTPEIEVMP